MDFKSSSKFIHHDDDDNQDQDDARRYGQIISTKAILDKATNRCKVSLSSRQEYENHGHKDKRMKFVQIMIYDDRVAGV